MTTTSSEYASLQKRIQGLRDRGTKLDPEDELRAEIAKYLCVLGSGLVEAAFRQAIAQLVSMTKPHDRLGRVATRFAVGLQNPKFAAIHQAVMHVDPVIAERLAKDSDESAQSALNSLVANRNLIAHGRNAAVSFSQATQYLDRLEPILKSVAKLAQK